MWKTPRGNGLHHASERNTIKIGKYAGKPPVALVFGVAPPDMERRPVMGSS